MASGESSGVVESGRRRGGVVASAAGWASGAAGFALDRALKSAVSSRYGSCGSEAVGGSLPSPFLPFVDVTAVCNAGISYGWFAEAGRGRQEAMAAMAFLACAGLSVWGFRSRRVAFRLALPILATGAASNALDRILYGGVFDYVSLHGFGFRWYAFNVADAMIAAAACLMIAEILFRRDAEASAAT